jgi:hypothetical protein
VPGAGGLVGGVAPHSTDAKVLPHKYIVEAVQETSLEWGTVYVADIRRADDNTLYRFGFAYSVRELVQQVLERLGR